MLRLINSMHSCPSTACIATFPIFFRRQWERERERWSDKLKWERKKKQGSHLSLDCQINHELIFILNLVCLMHVESAGSKTKQCYHFPLQTILTVSSILHRTFLTCTGYTAIQVLLHIAAGFGYSPNMQSTYVYVYLCVCLLYHHPT